MYGVPLPANRPAPPSAPPPTPPLAPSSAPPDPPPKAQKPAPKPKKVPKPTRLRGPPALPSSSIRTRGKAKADADPFRASAYLSSPSQSVDVYLCQEGEDGFQPRTVYRPKRKADTDPAEVTIAKEGIQCSKGFVAVETGRRWNLVMHFTEFGKKHARKPYDQFLAHIYVDGELEDKRIVLNAPSKWDPEEEEYKPVLWEGKKIDDMIRTLRFGNVKTVGEDSNNPDKDPTDLGKIQIYFTRMRWVQHKGEAKYGIGLNLPKKEVVEDIESSDSEEEEELVDPPALNRSETVVLPITTGVGAQIAAPGASSAAVEVSNGSGVPHVEPAAGVGGVPEQVGFAHLSAGQSKEAKVGNGAVLPDVVENGQAFAGPSKETAPGDTLGASGGTQGDGAPPISDQQPKQVKKKLAEKKIKKRLQTHYTKHRWVSTKPKPVIAAVPTPATPLEGDVKPTPDAQSAPMEVDPPMDIKPIPSLPAGTTSEGVPPGPIIDAKPSPPGPPPSATVDPPSEPVSKGKGKGKVKAPKVPRVKKVKAPKPPRPTTRWGYDEHNPEDRIEPGNVRSRGWFEMIEITYCGGPLLAAQGLMPNTFSTGSTDDEPAPELDEEKRARLNAALAYAEKMNSYSDESSDSDSEEDTTPGTIKAPPGPPVFINLMSDDEDEAPVMGKGKGKETVAIPVMEGSAVAETSADGTVRAREESEAEGEGPAKKQKIDAGIVVID